MKILTMAASNHSQSINGILARFVAERYRTQHQSDAEIEVIDLNAFEMPIYAIDREKADGVPSKAKELFALIGGADGLIISFAEYNGTYTSAWKNVHDWMSRIDQRIYQDKPLVALAATPGPRAGAGVLGTVSSSAPFFGASLCGEVGVGQWSKAYDPATNTLTNPDDLDRIDAALEAFGKALA